MWAALSFVEKVKFMFTLAHSGLFMPGADELREMTEELKEADALTKVCPCPTLLSHWSIQQITVVALDGP